VYAEDMQSLLRASDRARGGVEQGISWNVNIKSWENDTETERNFQVKAKGNNAYVESTDMGRFKGESFLFNDRTIWFFKPSLKKPVSISARERLSGQAANGDIASTNYARDYTPSLIKKEKINNDSVIVLLLKAKNKQMTYDQIRYWISEKDKLGIKAEFLTLSGKVFKIASFKYKNVVQIKNKKIPFVSEMLIQDANQLKNKSILTYDKPNLEAISENIFNVNNMSR
jgi:hypothetical protein